MLKLGLILFILLTSCTHNRRGPLWPKRQPANDELSINAEGPLRNLSELSKPYQETEVKRLEGARILYVDYELVRRDFPSVAHLSNPEIDDWLLKNTAHMSSTQVNQSNANDTIKVTSERRTAFRPEDYGRALIFRAENEQGAGIGYIDAKGVGAVNPRPGDHSDGLMTLGEAIREFTYEKMVNRIFIHEGSGLKTVGSYAVIDGGYAVKHADGSASPGGIILRQAHARAPGPSSTLSNEQTLRVEKILRKYGITSAGAYRHKYDFDRLNVQGTTKGAIIDFGGFLALEDFRGREAKHFFGNQVIYRDKSPKAIKPNPDLRVPLEQWGSAVEGIEDPKKDRPWNWSHELAKSFAEGRAQRDDAYNHLRNMWGPVFEKLNKSPRPAPQGCHDLLRALLQ